MWGVLLQDGLEGHVECVRLCVLGSYLGDLPLLCFKKKTCSSLILGRIRLKDYIKKIKIIKKELFFIWKIHRLQEK